jgi:hypothetical protein
MSHFHQHLWLLLLLLLLLPHWPAIVFIISFLPAVPNGPSNRNGNTFDGDRTQRNGSPVLSIRQ